MRLLFILLFCALSLSLPGQVNLGKKDIDCRGKKTGKVTVLSVTNATLPIKNYTWSNGVSGPKSKTIDKLGPGTYTVTVTDASGCTATGEETVEEPDSKLQLDITSSSGDFFVCGDASIIVTAAASGGTGGLKVNGEGATWVREIRNSYFGDGPKVIEFVAVDANGCKVERKQAFAFSSISCASDPNDISGPIGVDSLRWVASKDRMAYLVRFENDPNVATAPAQEVHVTVPVPDHINPFSIRLGDFGWGPYLFDVPDNSTSFQARLDLTSSLNLYVDVTAGLDVNENVFFWVLSSVDPATGFLPVDPQIGFLPVNDTSTASGEGFMNFTILPGTSAQTGDVVEAQAEIVFDVNESIFTNIWSNVLDAVAPTSAITPFSDTTEIAQIHFEFTGSDDPGGVGLLDYTLFASVDSAEFIQVASGIMTDTFTFHAQPGHHYRFFSRATDRVGNEEPLKAIPEATVLILPERILELDSPVSQHQCIADSLLIAWSKVVTDSVRVEISLDSGMTYFTLTASTVDTHLVVYIEDTMVTNNALIRVTDKEYPAINASSPVFAIHTLPDVDAGQDSSVCIGGFIYLSASGANSYQWGPDSFLDNPAVYNPKAFPDTTSIFFVTGTDVFGCRNSDTVEIIVYPHHLDSVIVEKCNEDSIFVGGGYQTEPGFYTDFLISSKGCDSTVVTQLINTGPCPFPSPVVYVDKDAMGLNNGTSWANAFTDLREGLKTVEYYFNVHEIWIAEGTYQTDPGANRDTSFVLRDSVHIYGGFVGTETIREERTTDPSFVEISGDIGVVSDSTDNAYHVFIIDPSCIGCVLDGMTIQFGQADVMTGQSSFGAGILNEGNLLLNNCILERNTAIQEGAAIYNNGVTAHLTIRDCIFRLNTSELARDILNAAGANIKFQGLIQVQE